MKKRKIIFDKSAYLQISFAWLFAIIVGVFILFLAIYFSTKLIQTENTIQDAKTSKEIGVLLNPLETGFEDGKSNSLSFPTETRIYNSCKEEGEFGRQLIKVSQKNFNAWSETNINSGFSNKYIFSEKYVEGEKFYIFSKQFSLGFKISDLILLTSSDEEYCFKNAPENIEEEILNLNQKNMLTENCSEDSIKVCFSGSCDVAVNLGTKQVLKNDDSMKFEGDALMFAAIFSDKDIYECQIKRLMKRLNNLAIIYETKSKFISSKGCETNLDLLTLENAANSLTSSSEISIVNSIAEDIEKKNDLGECKLW